MTEQLADLLAARLATLPLAGRVVGLAHPYADGPTEDRHTLPMPATFTPEDCERTPRYLVPDLQQASIWFFEDLGTTPGGIAGVAGSWRSTLRLLGWVNPQHFATPPTEQQLVTTVHKALGVGVRRAEGDYLDLLLSLAVLPADAGLFARYSGYRDLSLLQAPYRVVGLELTCVYRLAPSCVASMPERVTPVVC